MLNAKTIARTNAVVALLALGAMLPLCVGKFDISVGYQMGLAQALCAGLILKSHTPVVEALLIVFAAGAAIGLTNGLLIAFLGLDSFIVTLGVGILVLGINEAYTNNLQVIGTLPESFSNLGRNELAGIPLPFLYVLVGMVLLWGLLEYTGWGRRVFATGGSEKAALLAGVNTRRVTVQIFILTGLICAFAGILSVTMLGGSSPAIGLSEILPAFAGAFLGATSIRPGRYNAIGTVLAVYLLAAGITGLQQLGVAFYVQEFFNGGALLIAVAASVLIARARRSRAGLSSRIDQDRDEDGGVRSDSAPVAEPGLTNYISSPTLDDRGACAARSSAQRGSPKPSERPMISFMISFVPAQILVIRASAQARATSYSSM
jgi:ribose transport system permease protein